jgi:glycerol-3-phosphate acyltransferase PlsY
MSDSLITIVCLHFAAFMIGSVPTGYIIAKAKGVDIRGAGSGNVGATNVNRVLGASAGLYTLIGDIFKGLLGVSLVYLADAVLIDVRDLQTIPAVYLQPSYYAASVGFSTIAGHCFSPFLGFKGGKGVATSLGVFLLVCPLYLLVAVVIFAILVSLTRYVSLGSLSAAATLPLVVLIFEGTQNEVLLISTLCTTALVFFRHQGNIKRLISGTENKLKSKKSTETEVEAV